jgi:hypothetical protein
MPFRTALRHNQDEIAVGENDRLETAIAAALNIQGSGFRNRSS